MKGVGDDVEVGGDCDDGDNDSNSHCGSFVLMCLIF